MNAQKILRIAHGLMPASIALMVAGVYVGFIDHQAWSLQAQVGAHIGIMLGAALLKLSYVMYLNASKHLPANTCESTILRQLTTERAGRSLASGNLRDRNTSAPELR